MGKVCHNGKLVCGSLSAALTAGVLIAKFADTLHASRTWTLELFATCNAAAAP